MNFVPSASGLRTGKNGVWQLEEEAVSDEVGTAPARINGDGTELIGSISWSGVHHVASPQDRPGVSQVSIPKFREPSKAFVVIPTVERARWPILCIAVGSSEGAATVAAMGSPLGFLRTREPPGR